jgi:hypothetical protein
MAKTPVQDYRKTHHLFKNITHHKGVFPLNNSKFNIIGKSNKNLKMTLNTGKFLYLRQRSFSLSY